MILQTGALDDTFILLITGFLDISNGPYWFKALTLCASALANLYPVYVFEKDNFCQVILPL